MHRYKVIMTRFIFKLVEFDPVKISVVYLFPQTSKSNCGPKPHPVLNNISEKCWIFNFSHVSQANIIIIATNLAKKD